MKKQEEKEGTCDRPGVYLCGCGQNGSMWECVRGGCVTEDVWMSECVMLSAPPLCVYCWGEPKQALH